MMLARTSPGCRDVDVPLPLPLARWGEAAKARLSGPAEGPLLVVLGGISANRFVCSGPDGEPGWWPGLVGPGCAMDPARHRILGLDFAADPDGRHAPSTADQAAVLGVVLDAVGASVADAVIGASYGGMVALALAAEAPERVRRLVAVSAPAAPHPAATALREMQRRVVALGLESGAGREALAIARGIAMLSYRTPEEFAQRFAGGLVGDDALGMSDAGAYLRARGRAWCEVMPPGRFLSLSASIDRHRVDPDRVACPVLLIGAVSDGLVPPAQLEALHAALPDSSLHLLDSLYGHDMFLKDADRLAPLLDRFLDLP
ncbi:MAG: homoserine O-succinyltransferase [Allosphingosinicella sp.]|uniref:homoserine O-succinyltransferase MetX n=1 Tax=Allosphingosinicella sp. TaxID=2823234 RepID=UPI00392C6BFD